MNYYRIKIKDIDGNSWNWFMDADTALEAVNAIAPDITRMGIQPALITTSLVWGWS